MLNLLAEKKYVLPAYLVDLLARYGYNVNAENKKGNTPLHTAALLGDYSTIVGLVSHGADINKKNKCSETFLHLFPVTLLAENPEVACKFFQPEFQKIIDKNNQDFQGNTIFHHCAALLPYFNKMIPLKFDRNLRNFKGETVCDILLSDSNGICDYDELYNFIKTIVPESKRALKHPANHNIFTWSEEAIKKNDVGLVQYITENYYFAVHDTSCQQDWNALVGTIMDNCNEAARIFIKSGILDINQQFAGKETYLTKAIEK